MRQKAQTIIEYIVVFTVFVLLISGFIAGLGGTFNNYFQEIVGRVLQ